MPRLIASPPEFVDNAPVVVNVGRTIIASPEAIWAALTHNETWPEWFPDMKRCETTSSPGDGIGATRTVKVGNLVAEEQFIFWDRPKDWGFAMTKTNLPLAKQFVERVQLDTSTHQSDEARANTVTEVRYTGYIEPHLLMKPFAGLLKMQVRTTWEKALVGLAEHVER